jgi:hypothetical protein
MRIARSTGAFSGLLIAVLGIWGGLIPFVGPYFDYSFGTNQTWHYTTDRLWLSILPGALAVLGGLLLIGAITRASGVLGGWLAVIAGAWFAIGPAVSLTWEKAGENPIGAPLYSSTRQMFELVGYFYGLGALIVALGAFAIGRFGMPARVVGEERAARATGPAGAPAYAAGGVATGRSTRGERGEPARRRRLPFLRGRRARRGEVPAEAPARSDAEVPAR